jgi:hypothetical protein
LGLEMHLFTQAPYRKIFDVIQIQRKVFDELSFRRSDSAGTKNRRTR